MKTSRLIIASVSMTAIMLASSVPSFGVTKKGAVEPASTSGKSSANAAPTATPIKHLVVIFNENVSFDHYFATYPTATNPPNEPAFTAKAGTPTVDNLVSANLLTNNPNFTNPANGADATNPFRLDRTQAATADQNHAYTAEQQAYDGGANDLFPKYTGKGTPGGSGAFGTKGLVMGYFDGNTVAAMWNYAQHFAMSDNAFADTYGPSTPGALNLISGQTNGMSIVASNANYYYVNDGVGGYTMINDVDPAHDTCSSASNQALMTGKNIGDLLNTGGVTWGSFMGGFDLSLTNSNSTTGCARSTYSATVGSTVTDYIAHHAWFQYYTSTANPTHARPSSLAAIGYSLEQDGSTPEPANHNYDLQDFYSAVSAGNFPSVSFIKMPAYQDGHAGYSDPLDEQAGTVKLINFLQQQPDWSSTAVIITWDDSDGWYDHAFATVTSSSFDATADQLSGAGSCGSGTPANGVNNSPVNGRCGPGTRLPFLVVSPWAKPNYVGHGRISLASVTRFIEDNWLSGQRLGGGSFDASTGSISDLFNFASAGDNAPLYLDPTTGVSLVTSPHDFNADHRSDILWHNSNGSAAMWLMHGTSPATQTVIATVDTSWQIAGTSSLVQATGDFDADGKADMLWRKNDGTLAMWLMNGATPKAQVGIGAVDTAWQIAGTGDFDGDGKADILWRKSDGTLAMWLMNGTTPTTQVSLGAVGTAWQIVGIGDFDGDGKADILWRKSDGTLAMWLMNGPTPASQVALGTVDTAWQVVGVADFDGDSKADVLWRKTDGGLAIWEMNGTTPKAQVALGTVDTTWQVASTGDYDGDGKADILWRKSDGNVALWQMNGTTPTTQTVIGTIDTAWAVVE